MGKVMKIALAILYAVQVVVIFRESIDHLRSRGHEELGDIKQNQDQSQTPGDLRVLFKRAFQPIFKHHGLLAAAPLAGTVATVVLTEIKRKEDHVHPPEQKETLLVRKHRQHRIKEYLIANLYPLFKKFKPPAAPDLVAVCLNAGNRALVFPPANQ